MRATLLAVILATFTGCQHSQPTQPQYFPTNPLQVENTRLMREWTSARLQQLHLEGNYR